MIRAATSVPATTAPERARPVKPNQTSATAPVALALAVMPMMSGLASGLRASVWKSAPDSPRQPPTSTAARMRGTRSSRMTNCVRRSACPTSAARMSPGATDTAPRLSETAATSTISTATTTATRVSAEGLGRGRSAAHRLLRPRVTGSPACAGARAR